MAVEFVALRQEEIAVGSGWGEDGGGRVPLEKRIA